MDYTINILEYKLRRLKWLSKNKYNVFLDNHIKELEKAISILKKTNQL